MEDFESYNIEEEKVARRHTMWSLVPRIMVSPLSGWEATRKSGPNPVVAILRFLLPICLLAGGSEFFTLLYQVQVSLPDLMVNSVVVFFSYFLGYYISLLLAKLILPAVSKDFPLTDYGRLLTTASIGTLAFYRILFQAFPMFDFIIEFFPLWTVFLIYKGMKIADIDPDRSAFSMGVMCVVIICSPSLVEWILSLFT